MGVNRAPLRAARVSQTVKLWRLRAWLRATLACQVSKRWRLRAWFVHWRFPAAAEDWVSAFRGNTALPASAYADLMRYFVAGFVAHRSRLGAHADYPGMASYNGAAMDRLEGFSRMAPLMAAWLHGGRPAEITVGRGRTVNLVTLLHTGVLAGTDPASREYWGCIGHWSQTIVEASDIALALWLTRPLLWDALRDEERRQISEWLIQVNDKRIPDNNWHLFVVQVNAALAALDAPYDESALRLHYERAKSFYCGDGWFRDGEIGDTPGFDYYNAWGFHYHLHWISRMRPELDAAFIDDALSDFVTGYRHFMGPLGFPMMGRSACYRMAAPAPLIQAQQRKLEALPAGEARRALDETWRHFVRHGALVGGNVTQGYYGADRRLLENYSGPASCLWSLRSLVAAFSLPEAHPFWCERATALPVERDHFRVTIGAPGWTVIGDRQSLTITLLTGQHDDATLEGQGPLARVIDMLACEPQRPENIPAKYFRTSYDSMRPYGLLEAADAPSPGTMQGRP